MKLISYLATVATAFFISASIVSGADYSDPTGRVAITNPKNANSIIVVHRGHDATFRVQRLDHSVVSEESFTVRLQMCGNQPAKDLCNYNLLGDPGTKLHGLKFSPQDHNGQNITVTIPLATLTGTALLGVRRDSVYKFTTGKSRGIGPFTYTRSLTERFPIRLGIT